MKKGIFLIAFFLTQIAWANDPFDRTQRNLPESNLEQEETDLDAASLEINPNCGADENRQAADVPLHSMKLVGVMIGKDQTFAFLLDSSSQLYLIPEGADVAKEGYWLEKVNKENVQLMRKIGAQCDRVETKTLKF